VEKEVRQKILEMVHNRPCAINEIAFGIQRNWRTADRYCDELAKEDLIKVHVFRKGGRGALKIAYWPTSARTSPSTVKQFLYKRIIQGGKKEDFSPLDIVQHITPEYRTVQKLTKEQYEKQRIGSFVHELNQTQQSLLFFSGNLSFISAYEEVFKAVEEALARGVEIRILSRIDHTNEHLVRKLLSMNKRGHQGTLSIRYAFQPLRVTILDKSVISAKEDFSTYSAQKTTPSIYIYTVTDPSWVQWMEDIFWQLWHGAIDAEKRLEVIAEV
jgi:hypothetical protein